MIRLSKDTIDSSNDLGSAVLEKDPELKEPALYQVVLINDDYTPMEFVVYSKEIAEMMSYEVNNMAKNHNHPLLSEIEPLSD